MRKTTAYARRRARQGLSTCSEVLTINDLGMWARTIVKQKPYEDTANAHDADAIMNQHRLQFQRLLDRVVPSDDPEPHDALAHVVGISQIRTVDIAKNSDDEGREQANEIVLTLNEAAKGLHRMRDRWEKTKVWGLDGPAITVLKESMEIYETILRSSTPQQMEDAQNIRLDQLKKMQSR